MRYKNVGASYGPTAPNGGVRCNVQIAKTDISVTGAARPLRPFTDLAVQPGTHRMASPRSMATVAARRRTGSGSPARLPGEILGRFRRISPSSSSSRTFLHRAEFSASNGVGGSMDASARRPRGGLTPAARTQFRKVSGFTPRSAATDLIVASGRGLYNVTASALNPGGQYFMTPGHPFSWTQDPVSLGVQDQGCYRKLMVRLLAGMVPTMRTSNMLAPAGLALTVQVCKTALDLQPP